MSTHTKVRVSADTGQVMTVALYVLDCSSCGVIFGITKEYEDRRRFDGKGFCCPNGHSLSWSDTEADRQRRRAEQAERDLSDAHTTLIKERSKLRETKRTLTQERRRTAAAVCPCCSRSFVQLRRHLNTKHPDYVASTLEAKSE